MQVQIAHVPGCPNLAVARERLVEALERTGRHTAVRDLVVGTELEARALGMRGSPTILIDGRDPFATAESASLSCRLYSSGDGAAGAPSVAALMAAITRHDGSAGADDD